MNMCKKEKKQPVITSSLDLSGSDSVDRWNLSLNNVSENLNAMN